MSPSPGVGALSPTRWRQEVRPGDAQVQVPVGVRVRVRVRVGGAGGVMGRGPLSGGPRALATRTGGLPAPQPEEGPTSAPAAPPPAAPAAGAGGRAAEPRPASPRGRSGLRRRPPQKGLPAAWLPGPALETPPGPAGPARGGVAGARGPAMTARGSERGLLGCWSSAGPRCPRRPPRGGAGSGPGPVRADLPAGARRADGTEPGALVTWRGAQHRARPGGRAPGAVPPGVARAGATCAPRCRAPVRTPGRPWRPDAPRVDRDGNFVARESQLDGQLPDSGAGLSPAPRAPPPYGSPLRPRQAAAGRRGDPRDPVPAARTPAPPGPRRPGPRPPPRPAPAPGPRDVPGRAALLSRPPCGSSPHRTGRAGAAGRGGRTGRRPGPERAACREAQFFTPPARLRGTPADYTSQGAARGRARTTIPRRPRAGKRRSAPETRVSGHRRRPR